MSISPLYWERVPLEEMNAEQWELLCDGCGKCCLVKLEDEETNKVHYTNVACQLLDLEKGRCSDYKNRSSRIPDCVHLDRERIDSFHWLPSTCAYKLLADSRPLPSWHPLITGDRRRMNHLRIPITHYAISENTLTEQDDIQDYLTNDVS